MIPMRIEIVHPIAIKKLLNLFHHRHDGILRIVTCDDHCYNSYADYRIRYNLYIERSDGGGRERPKNIFDHDDLN